MSLKTLPFVIHLSFPLFMSFWISLRLFPMSWHWYHVSQFSFVFRFLLFSSSSLLCPALRMSLNTCALFLPSCFCFLFHRLSSRLCHPVSCLCIYHPASVFLLQPPWALHCIVIPIAIICLLIELWSTNKQFMTFCASPIDPRFFIWCSFLLNNSFCAVTFFSNVRSYRLEWCL